MRKPIEMSVREFFNHLVHINAMELPKLPPFQADQSLAEDELIDILLFAFPKSWQGEMERQGFDPITRSPTDVMKFCERLESADALEGKFQKVAKDGKTNGKNKPNKKAKASDGEKYCHFHGKGNHNSNDCKTLKAMAESAKKGKSGNNSGKSHGNKTWNKKADDAKKESAKELSALIRKQIRAELNAIEVDDSDNESAKRKADSDDEEVNAVEMANFDFDNLDIDDDDADDKSVKSEIST
jgi:hypothetical protein